MCSVMSIEINRFAKLPYAVLIANPLDLLLRIAYKHFLNLGIRFLAKKILVLTPYSVKLSQTLSIGSKLNE